MTSLKIDGVDATIVNPNEFSSTSYYYNRGSINISSLSVDTHTITAVISDGSLSKTLTNTFDVKGNLTPVISTPISAIFGDKVFYLEESGSTIKANRYTFSANVYDPDGDSFTTTVALDNVEVNGTEQNLSIGDHTLVVTAKDTKGNVSTKTISFTVGNLKPIITRAGISPDSVNLHISHNMTIYAFVNDPDGDDIASVIATDSVTNRHYTLTNGGSGAYYSRVVDASTIGVSNNRVFGAVATDDASNALSSEEKNVSVTIRDFNAAPIIEMPLSNQSISMVESVTLSVKARDPEGTRLSFVWRVDGVTNRGATSTGSQSELTLSNLGDGEYNVSCEVTDAEGAKVTTVATVSVFDPSKTHPLTIDIGIPKMTVTLHDSSNNFKKIDSKKTDDNGEAVFNVAGKTATFSIAFDPSATLTESQVYSVVLGNIINDAQDNCMRNSPQITQCINTDWCKLSTATTIPVWMFDEANVTNSSGATITGASVDTDQDSSISSSELYAAVLSVKDTNGDNALSMAEIDDAYMNISLYADVPVRKYVFKTDNQDKQQNNENCENDLSAKFDINVSNAANISYLSVDGSGGGYADNSNANSNIGASVYYWNYNKDSDGKYDFLIKMQDQNYTKEYIKLLLNKSKDDLKNDTYTYDALALSPITYKDVNITNDSLSSNIYVDSRYKGVFLEESKLIESDGNTTHYRYYNNSSFDYTVRGWADNMSGLSYRENNYDDNRVLKSSYKASDYPMLDVNISEETNNSSHIIFSGSDLGLIDYSVIGIRVEKTSTNSSDTIFAMSIFSFANPTRGIDFDDMNVSEMFPADIASQIDTDGNNTYTSAFAIEFKNKTAAEMIDKMLGDSFDYYDGVEATRSVSYQSHGAAVYKNAPTRKVLGKVTNKPKSTNIANPFDLRIDMKKLFD